MVPTWWRLEHQAKDLGRDQRCAGQGWITEIIEPNSLCTAPCEGRCQPGELGGPTRGG